MASIYDIPTWDAGVTYVKNDIVKDHRAEYPNRYWYGLEGSAGVEPSWLSAAGQAAWGGVRFDFERGKNRPHFIWVPSYQSVSQFQPVVKIIKLGDGYEQRVSPNINNNLISLDVRFELRSTQEARAILHFLHLRRGVEPFIFDPPDPLNSEKDQYFVCNSWNNSFNFYDNQSLGLKFLQTASF